MRGGRCLVSWSACRSAGRALAVLGLRVGPDQASAWLDAGPRRLAGIVSLRHMGWHCSARYLPSPRLTVGEQGLGLAPAQPGAGMLNPRQLLLRPADIAMASILTSNSLADLGLWVCSRAGPSGLSVRGLPQRERRATHQQPRQQQLGASRCCLLRAGCRVRARCLHGRLGYAMT